MMGFMLLPLHSEHWRRSTIFLVVLACGQVGVGRRRGKEAVC